MTLEDILALKPCNPETRVAMFAGRKSMNISEAFESGATVSDICWLMGKLKRLDDIISFANFCADQARVDAAADDADAAADDADDAADDAAARAAAAADDADDAADDAAARAARAAADDAAARAARAAARAAQKAFLIKLLSE